MVTAPTAPAVKGALIRKGIALAVHPDGIRFGEWLVRELRGLIKAVAEDKDHTILNPIQARLRACLTRTTWEDAVSSSNGLSKTSVQVLDRSPGPMSVRV